MKIDVFIKNSPDGSLIFLFHYETEEDIRDNYRSINDVANGKGTGNRKIFCPTCRLFSDEFNYLSGDELATVANLP